LERRKAKWKTKKEEEAERQEENEEENKEILAQQQQHPTEFMVYSKLINITQTPAQVFSSDRPTAEQADDRERSLQWWPAQRLHPSQWCLQKKKKKKKKKMECMKE
jgi:hypothetical protein